MNTLAIHLIKRNNIYVAYDSSNMDISIVNYPLFKRLRELQKDIVEKTNSNKENHHFSKDIRDFILPKINDEISTTQRTPSPVVKRITVHVSNDCNLRCKYCYAEGGNYKQDRGIMSIQTAQDFVDFCCNNFKEIKRIVFFGGEPTMNIPAMEYICQRFKTKYSNGGSSFIPIFGMITNGTILNENVVKFIKEHLSFITISIDGPREINDLNRTFTNGKGTYERISAFIYKIRQETNVNVTFESTFTKQHIEKGYTHYSIKKALNNEFGIKGKVIDELSIQNNIDLDFWSNFDFSEWCKKEPLVIPNGFWDILFAIKQKQTRKMCGIGENIFAVSTNGEIYPCHINNGEKQNSLGNLNYNVFNNLNLREQFPANKLKNNNNCNACWAYHLCGGCSRMFFYDFIHKKYKNTPNKKICKRIKTHIENILLLIVLCRKDPIVWGKLLKMNRINF